ncbi:MAG: carbohydrate kinase family protein [Candidatus Pacebacteria bacterium]|nr:carbohydrate kinase family protein [Candidatus Paceibacterota bacterium]
MENPLDFVAIGDTAVDAFIRLKETGAHTDHRVDKNLGELCMPFGAKVPYDFVKIVYAEGNAANACVSAARLGLKTALVTDMGKDDAGEKCLKSLTAEGIDSRYIEMNEGMKTSYHYVLWYGDDRTILTKHEIFPYKLPLTGPAPKWFYLTSLGETSLEFHNEIADYLSSHPETKLAFQPGTFQIKQGAETLKHIYAKTEVFFCNVEEARLILKTEEPEPKNLAKMMTTLGPKIAVITDGSNGAYVYDGKDSWFMPIYPDPQPAYERTGAGDAFSSTFVSALALGKTPAEAITWAPINSMSVVQKIGAQEGLLTRAKIEEALATAPASYKEARL